MKANFAKLNPDPGLDCDGEIDGRKDDDAALIDALSRSKIFRDYARAFAAAVQVPVCLRSVESWSLPFRGKKGESPFCTIMAGRSPACTACLRARREPSHPAYHKANTISCFAGMCHTSVPVHLGGRVIGILQTGQVFRKQPSQEQFECITNKLQTWGVNVREADLRDAYFATRVLPPAQHRAVTVLLDIFAQHLATLSNQLLVRQQHAEPPMIVRAKEFIAKNQGEELSLGAVAKAVNASTFYFCKMFRKATGLNFTEYVSRLRIEKAKNLLLNPNLRVSEIAFEAGFQSLTHFNRVFKNIVGESPTEYRGQIAMAA